MRDFFEKRIPLGQVIHKKIMNDFRQYLLVGGMPQSVNEYINTKNFNRVDEVKRNVLSLYRNDIVKFSGSNQNKVLAIFDEIPGQLSKKEKKYNLSSISKEARLREYEDSFMWLDDSMIINTCYNSTDPNIGLSLSSEHSKRKCYMGDTGLLVTQVFYDKDILDNNLYKDILFDKLSINEGMLMENMVAQILRFNGYKLYFYSRNDKVNRKNHMEIDFLLSKNNKIIPIEVKSSSYRKHSSLDKFSEKFKERVDDRIILYQKDLAIINGVLHLPIYMTMFL